jgi:hypothetical protein
MENKEQRIRDIAHRIWEEECRPFGQEDQHWDKARQIVDRKDAERAELASGPEAISSQR